LLSTYKLAEWGKIPYVKLGKSLRFDKEDVIRWFEEQKTTGNKTNKIMED
jgi:helix-turn-helix protein